jgi:hypothetical protein
MPVGRSALLLGAERASTKPCDLSGDIRCRIVVKSTLTLIGVPQSACFTEKRGPTELSQVLGAAAIALQGPGD